MANKTWISITDGYEEGEAAKKTVLSSNYANQMDTDNSGFTEISYQLSGIWSDTEPFNYSNFTLMDLPEAGFTAEVGAPMLIREGLFVAIPENAVFDHLEVIPIKQMEFHIENDIIPVPQLTLESETQYFKTDENIYNSENGYPSFIGEYVGEEIIMGIKNAHLYIFPMKYFPKENKVILYTEIKIKVEYTFQDMNRNNPIIDNNIFEPLLLGYSNERDSIEIKKKPRMIIVTTKDLIYSLEIYKGIKTFLYDTEIVPIETIYKMYPHDNKDEALFKYVNAEHKKRAIYHLVLGGGIDKIPTHKANNTFASDSYYSTNGKSVVPRYIVSRFPASNKEEMNEQCDLASYYNRFYNETRKTTVFTTFNRCDYEQCKEDISKAISSDFTVVKRYDGKCKKKELINAINKGAGFINYRGHGSHNCWQSSIGLNTKDVPKLEVGNNTPHVLSIACLNNNLYKKNCFGVAWLKHCKAISFLGASNPSYTSINHKFDKYLWEAISNEELEVIGDIYLWATIKLYQNDKSCAAIDNIKMYLLLGDGSADYLENKA